MSTEIRIALVFQQEEGTQALRMALANAGVIVAVESRASALDPTVVFASDVDAIVVNLDAELEELLDDVRYPGRSDQATKCYQIAANRACPAPSSGVP